MGKRVDDYNHESENKMNILHSPLMRNIGEEEFENMRKVHGTRECRYEKSAIIFHAGDRIHEIGIVMDGSVNIENLDLWGNKSILNNVPAGGTFAETYALCREPMMVDVVAAEESSILFFHVSSLVDSKNEGYSWYAKLLVNLLEISMRKNLALSERIFCTAPKTIRGRLLIFLSIQSKKAGSSTFQIPFSRQQLAEYLNLDRSALSKELGKMRNDGLIDFYKNTFKIRHIL